MSEERRLQGACDICRQKKTRCDSAKMPGSICSNCLAFGSACTHLSARNRKILGGNEQSEGLDINNEGTYLWDSEHEAIHAPIRSQVAAILSSSNPYLVPKDHSAVRHTLVELARYIQILEHELIALRQSEAQEQTSPSVTQSFQTSLPGYSSETYADMYALAITNAMDNVVLSDDLKTLTSEKSQARFYGMSSNIMLIKAAMEIKKECTGNSGLYLEPHVLGDKRPGFWSVHPWQFVPDGRAPLLFPEDDLMDDLVDLFFAHVNVYFPVLHRPTFERSIGEGLHKRHQEFGSLVLAVCATAARYSDDPRVFIDISTENTAHTAGWKWFQQVRPMKSSFLVPTCVYELQLCSISIIYLQGTSTPEGCWVLLGLGIRLAQDVGAHRKKHTDGERTVENELWNRAFWSLIAIDIIFSATQERPRATSANDFDLDLPVDCDDAYWEHPDPALAFMQPPGTPSKVSAWIHFLKLLDILAYAQRTIYAIKVSDVWMDFTSPHQDPPAIVQIDSALNRWIDSVPDHLRWDPHRENQVFFDQSAMMYATYYYIQIVVHRPQIVVHRPIISCHNRDTSFRSLAICANAARSCSHVMDIQSRRGYLPIPNIQMALFNAAIVLLLNVWGGRRLGLSNNPSREIMDVYRCINVLRSYEQRFQVTGRLCDLLEQLISVGNLHYPSSEAVSLKRGRGTNRHDPSASVSEFGPEFQNQSIGSANNAPNAPAISPHQPFVQSLPESDPERSGQSWGLPLYTNELGSLPVHESFDFLDESQRSLSNTAWLENYHRRAKYQRVESTHPIGVIDAMASVARTETSESYPMRPLDWTDHADMGQHPLAYDVVDAENVTVWSNAPGGYDLETWNSYLASLEGLTQSSTTASYADTYLTLICYVSVEVI